MQPPKVNSKLGADELARDARQADMGADRLTEEGHDTDLPASEDDADTDVAGDIADAQEKVVDRGLTRLPPG
ncbi:hypothetical protein [Croceibacterium ferulae]|uniref:hypothetical protein n=1 Tax=Croceibacterium ferulae TaxID=1854641 RepID=UPI000EAE17CE|nr:hypothetical protein [Croceibacterium ferulae]